MLIGSARRGIITREKVDMILTSSESRLLISDVFFAPDETVDTSFYNPNNWISDEESFLHMNQVPSEDVSEGILNLKSWLFLQDDVTISSLTSAQLYLDIPVTVNRFQYYKRDVSHCQRQRRHKNNGSLWRGCFVAEILVRDGIIRLRVRGRASKTSKSI